MKQFLYFSLLAILYSCSNSSVNNELDLKDVESQLTFFQEHIQIPDAYKFKNVYEVKVEKEDAYWFRYEKDSNIGLMKEHYSFVISKKQPYTILGFTEMDAKYLDMPLISEEECKKAAKKFLEKIDPALENELELQSVSRYDEEIIMDGKKKVLSGMRYKCYRSSQNDYAWVIVANDGSIITFERNLVWSNIMMSRSTEKWLYDKWLIENKIEF